MSKSLAVQVLRNLLVWAVSAVLLIGCNAAGLPSARGTPSPPANPGAPAGADGLQQIPMQAGYGARGSFYEIYFTDPFSLHADDLDGGPDVPLVQAIDQARISVDVAAYSLSLYSIQNALIRARQRGIPVRMVMETDNMNSSVPQALIAAGIPIIGDRRSGLMHDKFVVIDRAEVWTGSMNFTFDGAYADNNNLVRIRSGKVAADYTVEFEEMFTDNFFGSDVIAATPYSHVMIDGVPVEVYFSPDDHVATRIIDLLRGAQQSIYFMAYSFTASDFGQVLMQKAGQGLTVAGLFEASQLETGGRSQFEPFLEDGLPVYLDGNAGLLHHKVIIIDQRIVITGSYNFSLSAETINDENVVIFFDPQIAAQYLAEYQRVYTERSILPFVTETPTPSPTPTPVPEFIGGSSTSSGSYSSGTYSSSGSSSSFSSSYYDSSGSTSSGN